MSLRLFHSIWTAPQNTDRWGVEREKRNYVDLLCTAISVACAKKNGCEIALHTDIKGKERYGWLPYDEIHLTLQSHQYDTSFWASGKIISQQYEPLGSIHIDTDVFVKTKRTVEMMQELKHFDLLIQHTEWDYSQSYNRETWGMLINILGSSHVPSLPEFILTPCHAYCCGVVGFNSQALKDLYIVGYEFLYNMLVNRPLFHELKHDFCPDLIIEQGWLYSAAQAIGARVKQVLANNNKIDAYKNDFVHVINTAKYKPEIISQLEFFLKHISPVLYDGIKQRIFTF